MSMQVIQYKLPVCLKSPTETDPEGLFCLIAPDPALPAPTRRKRTAPSRGRGRPRHTNLYPKRSQPTAPSNYAKPDMPPCARWNLQLTCTGRSNAPNPAAHAAGFQAETGGPERCP